MGKHALFAAGGRLDELELGLRLARELASREHQVSLVGAPWTGEYAALEGVPFQAVTGQEVLSALEAACEENDSVLVVDLFALVGMLGSAKIERARALRELIALDPWGVGLGGKTVDMGKTARALPKTTLLTEKRLVPAPIASADADGAFRAVPDLPEKGSERRERARRALGVKDEKVLLLVTHAWQLEAAHTEKGPRVLARRVPELLGELVSELGSDVFVLHVGPEPMSWGGERYTWLVHASAARTHNRFAAADALLTLDASSSALAWAIAWRTPTVVIQSSCAGDDLKRVRASAPFTLTERATAWVKESLPLQTFRAWPLGLHETLEPAAGQELSYLPIELLDEQGFLDGVRAMLFDEGERKRAIRDQDEIARSLADLPSGGDLWEMIAAAG